jgi:hypothetical protein
MDLKYTAKKTASGCVENECYTSGMFALPVLVSHVSSAAFAQAGVRSGSASAQVCSGLLILFTRILEMIDF